jgi:ABC-2 type transport system permease protein
MRAAVLITRKDLRQRLRDRTAIVTALVLPLVMTMILDTTAPNTTDKSTSKFKFGVVNEDHGAAALFLVKEVLEPLQGKKLLQLYPASSARAGRALVGDGKVNTTLVVPPGFTQAVDGETATHLEIVGNGQIFKQAGNFVARSIALSFANQSNGVRLAMASTRKQHGTSAEFVRLGEHASTLPKQLAIHETGLPSKELDPKTREAAGLAVLFLFLTVQFGFTNIIDERAHGVLARLLAASVSRRAIVGGKLLTSVVLGLLSMAALVVASTLILGAHWGGVPGVALLVLACVLAATAMTACLASFAQTSEQALQWQVIAAALLGALGGALFPVAQAGGALAWLSRLTPHAQFLRGLGVLSHGAGPGAVLPMVEAILAFAVVLGGVAALRMRHLVRV